MKTDDNTQDILRSNGHTTMLLTWDEWNRQHIVNLLWFTMLQSKIDITLQQRLHACQQVNNSFLGSISSAILLQSQSQPQITAVTHSMSSMFHYLISVHFLLQFTQDKTQFSWSSRAWCHSTLFFVLLLLHLSFQHTSNNLLQFSVIHYFHIPCFSPQLTSKNSQITLSEKWFFAADESLIYFTKCEHQSTTWHKSMTKTDDIWPLCTVEWDWLQIAHNVINNQITTYCSWYKGLSLPQVPLKICSQLFEKWW